MARPAADEPEPASPEEEGVDSQDPPPMQIEPAHLLANEVRERLRADGFTDEQIDSWAETFTAEHGAGDAEDLIAWIAEQEGR